MTKEINYLSNYIQLQKIRLGETVQVKFEITGNAEEKQIAPLILIPFVENAFKHGVNPEENSVIEISIQLHENELRLYVQNRKVNNIALDEPESKIGLENVKQRLLLLYPSRHLLHLNNQPDSFSVSLTLVLT